jgi:hypothetical protein
LSSQHKLSNSIDTSITWFAGIDKTRAFNRLDKSKSNGFLADSFARRVVDTTIVQNIACDHTRRAIEKLEKTPNSESKNVEGHILNSATFRNTLANLFA